MKSSKLGLLATVAVFFTPVAAFAQDSQESLQINNSAGSAAGYGNVIYQDTTQNHNVPMPIDAEYGGDTYGDAQGGNGSETPHVVDNVYDSSYGGASSTTDSDGCTYFTDYSSGLSINSCDPNW